jgi:hypothetical protein
VFISAGSRCVASRRGPDTFSRRPTPLLLSPDGRRLHSERHAVSLDEEQLRSRTELLLDDRSAVGAGAAPPQREHWRGRRSHAGVCLLLPRFDSPRESRARAHRSDRGSREGRVRGSASGTRSARARLYGAHRAVETTRRPERASRAHQIAAARGGCKLRSSSATLRAYCLLGVARQLR